MGDMMDLDKEAERLGSVDKKEEERRKAQEKEEEEKGMKEKRDSLLLELGQCELLINEKENVFTRYIKNAIESGDPTLLLDQIDGILTEVNSLALKLENDIDVKLTLLRNINRSYAEEVNQKRQSLQTRCESIKEEMKKSIDSLKERKEKRMSAEQQQQKLLEEEKQREREREQQKLIEERKQMERERLLLEQQKKELEEK